MRGLRLREVSGSLKGLELSLGPGPSDSSTLFLTTRFHLVELGTSEREDAVMEEQWVSECCLPGLCRGEALFQEGVGHGPARPSELRERAVLCPGGNRVRVAGMEGGERNGGPGKSGLLGFPGLSQQML